MVAMLLSLLPSKASRSPAAAQPMPFGFYPKPQAGGGQVQRKVRRSSARTAIPLLQKQRGPLIRKRPLLETKPRHEYSTTGTVRDQDLLSTRSSGIDHRPPRGAHSEPSHA